MEGVMNLKEKRIIKKCAELCKEGNSSEALRYVDFTIDILSEKTEKLIQSLQRLPI
jgi:hypothetical protein